MSPNGTAALAYASVLGVAVFPVGPDCRIPWVEHGVYDASRDPAVIGEWWRRWPRSNIAAAMGNPAFALDIDCKKANGFNSLRSLEVQHGPLPVTWRASTPSGGQHVWFQQPEGRPLRNRVNFAPGLDVRTAGGSVALPPSAKPSGPYVWTVRPLSVPLATAPDWLLELIDPPAVIRPPAPPLQFRNTDRLARYLVAAVDGECGAVAAMAPNTGRNQRLFQAAARLGELVGSGTLPQSHAEAALERAAAECGLTHEDGLLAVRATIKSGLGRGVANPREVAA